MDAALKAMYTLRKARHLELAALKDARSGYLHSGEAHSALRYGRLIRSIEPSDKTAAELCHLGERMRLAALVHRDDWRSFVHRKLVGFEIPVRVGASDLSF